MNDSQLQKTKQEIEEIEAHGHGEVIVKIKNGHIYRWLATKDTLDETLLTKQAD